MYAGILIRKFPFPRHWPSGIPYNFFFYYSIQGTEHGKENTLAGHRGFFFFFFSSSFHTFSRPRPSPLLHPLLAFEGSEAIPLVGGNPFLHLLPSLAAGFETDEPFHPGITTTFFAVDALLTQFKTTPPHMARTNHFSPLGVFTLSFYFQSYCAAAQQPSLWRAHF